jgi:uncharacterized protein (DUF1015 family)
VPRFEPFRALRYSDRSAISALCAPPYDVLSTDDRSDLALQSVANIVHIDLPLATEDLDPYANAAATLQEWIRLDIIVRDESPSLTIYRTEFVDPSGKHRSIVGVIGALEVVDEGAGGVLPHEQTTPKAKTDRLDLTRSTDCNLSPVWGLSTATGLSDLLRVQAEPVGSLLDLYGVRHSVERVTDVNRLKAICLAVETSAVVIADGHHRYAISRIYRDEVRVRTGLHSTGAELTLTYINELIEDQLSVAAIHRVYTDTTSAVLLDALKEFFAVQDAPPIDNSTLQEMDRRKSLLFIDQQQRTFWLTAKASAFQDVRDLDSARLEWALRSTPHTVGYQHGVDEVVAQLREEVVAAILIRPVSVQEIQRTATEGLLMPPKSTFFTPKLRTGLVMRELLTR